MARLQILELPEGSGDDQPPFVLVIDQYQPPPYPAEPEPSPFDGVAELIGARAVLAFEETIDIPANDTTAYLQQVAEETGATIGKITSTFTAQTLAAERNDIASDMDRLATRRDELTGALGMDRGSSWDDIRNTALGLRKQRDAQTEALECVRNLPEEPTAINAQDPDNTSYLRGYRVATRDAKRAIYAFRASSDTERSTEE